MDYSSEETKSQDCRGRSQEWTQGRTVPETLEMVGKPSRRRVRSNPLKSHDFHLGIQLCRRWHTTTPPIVVHLWVEDGRFVHWQGLSVEVQTGEQRDYECDAARCVLQGTDFTQPWVGGAGESGKASVNLRRQACPRAKWDSTEEADGKV